MPENHPNELVGETAKIEWRSLEKFFAGGYTIEVQRPLDLIQIAQLFKDDNAETLKPIMDAGSVRPVPDAQALRWYEDNAFVWAVVLAPWVLVQDLAENDPDRN